MIINRGRLVAESPLEELTARVGGGVRVRSPQWRTLADALARAGLPASNGTAEELHVSGTTSARVGEIAAAEHIVLHELTAEQSSLEEVFFELTTEGPA